MLIWRKRISQKVVAIDPTVTLLVLSVAIEERGRVVGGGEGGVKVILTMSQNDAQD